MKQPATTAPHPISKKTSALPKISDSLRDRDFTTRPITPAEVEQWCLGEDYLSTENLALHRENMYFLTGIFICNPDIARQFFLALVSLEKEAPVFWLYSFINRAAPAKEFFTNSYFDVLDQALKDSIISPEQIHALTSSFTSEQIFVQYKRLPKESKLKLVFLNHYLDNQSSSHIRLQLPSFSTAEGAATEAASTTLAPNADELYDITHYVRYIYAQTKDINYLEPLYYLTLENYDKLAKSFFEEYPEPDEALLRNKKLFLTLFLSKKLHRGDIFSDGNINLTRIVALRNNFISFLDSYPLFSQFYQIALGYFGISPFISIAIADKQEYRIFELAAKYGKIDFLNSLVHMSNQAISNEMASSRMAYIAASLGKRDVLNWIAVNYRALLIKKDAQGFTIAHMAATPGNIDALNWIAERNPDLLNEKTNNGITIAHIVAENGKLEVFNWIAERNPDLLNEKTNNGITIAHIVAKKGNIDALNWIAERNPDLLNEKTNNGFTIAHIVTENGKIEVLNWIAERNPDLLNEKTNSGITIAYIVAKKGNIDALNWIAERNPDLLNEKTNNGFTIAHIVAEKGNIEVLNWIAKKNPDLLNEKNNNGFTIAHIFAENGNIDALNWIAERNPDLLNEKNNNGISIAHNAALSSNTNALNWIAKRNPDLLNKKTNNGITIAHIVAEKGNIEVLDWVIKNVPELFIYTHQVRSLTKWAQEKKCNEEILNAIKQIKTNEEIAVSSGMRGAKHSREDHSESDDTPSVLKRAAVGREGAEGPVSAAIPTSSIAASAAGAESFNGDASSAAQNLRGALSSPRPTSQAAASTRYQTRSQTELARRAALDGIGALGRK